jgi:hypothetical protein
MQSAFCISFDRDRKPDGAACDVECMNLMHLGIIARSGLQRISN